MYAPDVRYLAGFFDGEGHVGLYATDIKTKEGTAHPNFGRIVLGVGGTHRESIELWHEKYGGTLHCNPAHGNNRPVWRWSVSGLKAQQVLRDLFPYLLIKRDQAELILSIKFGHPGCRLTEAERNRRIEIAHRVHALKKAA